MIKQLLGFEVAANNVAGFLTQKLNSIIFFRTLSRTTGSSYRRSTSPSIAAPSLFPLVSRHSPPSMLAASLSRRRSSDLFDFYHPGFSTF